MAVLGYLSFSVVGLIYWALSDIMDTFASPPWVDEGDPWWLHKAQLELVLFYATVARLRVVWTWTATGDQSHSRRGKS